MSERNVGLSKFSKISIAALFAITGATSIAAFGSNSRSSVESVWETSLSDLNKDVLLKIDANPSRLHIKDDVLNFLKLGESYLLGGDGKLKVYYVDDKGKLREDEIDFGGPDDPKNYFQLLNNINKHLDPGALFVDVQFEFDKISKSEGGISVAMIKSQIHFADKPEDSSVFYSVSVIGPKGNNTGIEMSIKKDEENINLLRESGKWTYLRLSDWEYLNSLSDSLPESLGKYADNRISQALLKKIIDGAVNKD